MISELDETIRQILLNEGRLDPLQVDVSFEIPDSEWSAGISKPTLNCYLFDIRENRELLAHGVVPTERTRGGAVRMRLPLYLDLTYLVTAWTRAVEDEHNLLWFVLSTLIRFPVLPQSRLQGPLRELGRPIHTTVARSEGVLKSPGEFWTALENKIKPSLSFVVTLALDRDSLPESGPPVTERPQITYTQPVRGIVRNTLGTPQQGVSVSVEGDESRSVMTDADGTFVLFDGGNGPVTLRINRDAGPVSVRVPSRSELYAIVLD